MSKFKCWIRKREILTKESSWAYEATVDAPTCSLAAIKYAEGLDGLLDDVEYVAVLPLNGDDIFPGVYKLTSKRTFRAVREQWTNE